MSCLEIPYVQGQTPQDTRVTDLYPRTWDGPPQIG